MRAVQQNFTNFWRSFPSLTQTARHHGTFAPAEDSNAIVSQLVTDFTILTGWEFAFGSSGPWAEVRL